MPAIVAAVQHVHALLVDCLLVFECAFVHVGTTERVAVSISQAAGVQGRCAGDSVLDSCGCSQV